ncbi:MAG: HAD family phosphatase [Bryobacteraceae bacterium]|jgi:putative hydrolase of the HAD superfamily
MIRALIFDLGRVLLNLTPEASYARMAALSGLSRDEIQLRLRDSRLNYEFESGRISARDFAQKVCGLLGTAVPFEDFREVWYAMVDQGAIIPEQFIASLHKSYRLVLLSNTNELHFDMLKERCPMLSHFDGYTLSYEVGVQKPDEAIYRDAVAKANCQARECFYTDDIQAYVEAARRIGIQAAQFRGLEELKTDLRGAGVEI